MKSIAFIVPYFGKLPNIGFKLWLMSCSTNQTIDWIIFTDDHTLYEYPSNVRVIYCSFDDIRERIQKKSGFKIALDRGWKLCDYRVAYGNIFSDELQGYDFWGHCDIDLMWGDIRKFITDDILDKYEKIGFLGHSTIYKNIPEVNNRYRIKIPGFISYKEVFSNTNSYAFDEVGIEEIYKEIGIEYFKKVNFANLMKYDYNFYLGNLPKEDDYKNRRQIFTWKDGVLLRWYLNEGSIYKEEYMYIHFWCRPMTYHIKKYNKDIQYIIYSDSITDKQLKITQKYINRKGKKHPILFYIKSAYLNRHKLTLQRIKANIQRMIADKKLKSIK